jgi:TetR/AcrR family transcriptional regulator, cholesterol catabolism regulator
MAVRTEAGAGRTPRARLAERRRIEIFDTAAQVFAEKGYGATTLQDIADRVGLLKGSLYHYISTKEDLLFEIIRDVQEDGLRVLADAMGEEGPVDKRLREFLRRYALYTIESRVKAFVFVRELRSLPPERIQVLMESRDRYDDYVRECIRTGVEQGAFRPDLDPIIHSNLGLQMIQTVYLWYRPDGRLSAEEIADLIAEMVLRGLLVTPPETTPPPRPPRTQRTPARRARPTPRSGVAPT